MVDDSFYQLANYLYRFLKFTGIFTPLKQELKLNPQQSPI